MANKGYIHPPGTPGVMQREFEFPTFMPQRDPGGYVGSYKKRKKVTAKGHTLQSRKRAERLKTGQYIKKFRGQSRKKILV
jgi:hypothetical protein